MPRRNFTVADALDFIFASGSEEDGSSEPEGFDSSEEEEYRDSRDPFEDGEVSQLPGPSCPQMTFIQEPPAVPATMLRSTVDQGPSPLPSPPSTSGPASRQLPPSLPATRSRYTSAPPQPQPSPRTAKRSRRAHVPPTQPPAAHAPSPPPAQQPVPLSWKTGEDPDTAPPVSRFQPARTPGPQLSSTVSNKPLDLFKLFFSALTVQTLCTNTNKRAAQEMGKGKTYKWTDLTVEDFYKYIGLLKLDNVLDYWRKDHFVSV
ncbi:WW domain-binding protein 11-like [Gymnodraco acuticeps]|uniref:WW domain-binding protein 11-like n=1 Tax=Gymnodraco acuticeps TaxID=8218 RepID=A0A6P8VMX0_GYMAC|nr:WW domain-binding protein 11-like [Gymnodraco acuticeps]